MSGIEVAGLVLGSIPLVISALKYYDHGIMTIERARSYTRYRMTLIEALNEERTRLENICEFILDGLVPKFDIERMIADPWGDLWKDEALKLKLRARLWNSLTQFEQTSQEMRTAMRELMDKLDVGPDGKFRNSNPSFISLQIRRVVLALSKPTHDRMLSKIADCTTKLYSIADLNIRLEPKRSQRSQVKILAMLRDLCISLHWALQKSLACDCRHRVRLKLRTVPSEVLHVENEIQKLQHLALFLRISHPINLLRDLENKTLSYDWEDLRVEGLSTVSLNTTALMSLPEFSPGLETTPSLCEMIKKAEKQNQCTYSYYGHIMDDERRRKFTVYPLHSDDAAMPSNTAISLREALDRTPNVPILTMKDRYHLAVVIASNVAQLCNTAWLPSSLSADKITFAPKQNSYLYNNAFIERSSHPTSMKPILLNSTSSCRNLSVISLAFLLTELILDISIFSAEEVLNNLDRAYYTVHRLLPKVRGESEQYYLAISRCLFESKLHTDMQNGDQFRETMYSGVVLPLEEELRALEISF